MKKKIIFVAISLVIVLVSILVVVALNTPTNIALRSIKNLANDFSSRDEISPICETLTGGSIKVSLDSITETYNGETEDLFENSYISGKLYFSKEGMMLKDFDSMIYGNKFAGEAYLSTDEFYIQEDYILDGAYGVNILTLAKELENSIFAPDSNTSYEMDEQTYNRLVSALNNISEESNLKDDITNLIESTIEDVLKIITENAEIESEKRTTRIGNEKTKVRLITITIDDNAMKNILTDIYDYLYTSDNIVDFIEKYNDALIAMLGEEYDDSEYNSLLEAYEELLEELEDEIDDICDDIDDDFDTLKISIATPRMRAKLLKLEVELGNKNLFLLDCGAKGIKKTDSITIDFPDEDIKITYNVSDSNDYYESKITIKDYDDAYEISSSFDKKRGNYTVQFEENYNNSFDNKYIIKGNFSTKDETINLTIDKITNKWKSSYSESKSELKLKCNIIIDSKDEMPAKNTNYNGISSITENKLDTWIKKLEELDF